ncbi:MAG TPA: hypothetical protein VEQ85_08520 [Lacipirellulaceae bacterium]|nr:hypothetical protein [Lacipirellulaceae bacterium]
MSTVLTPVDLAERAEFEYRPLSTLAVASVVLGLLSFLVVLAGRDTLESALMLCPLPLIGIAVGLRALGQIRATPDAVKGVAAARTGIGLSTVALVAGLAFASYVHATEVPPGYARTSFAEFKPDDVDIRASRLVPPQVAALNGKKVFIKGYFRPDSSQYTHNVKEFLLVRDNNQCCFGDISSVQFYDQLKVEMAGNLLVDRSMSLYRMGGTLRITPENAVNGSGLPVYKLEADYAE